MGNTNNIHSMCCISLNHKPKQVYTGCNNSSFVLCENNIIYAFGNNKGGKLVCVQ